MGLHMKRQISLLAVLLFIFLLFIPVLSCADEGVAEVSSKEEFESGNYEPCQACLPDEE